MYSLELIKLKILKTYIKNCLMNNFVKLFKFKQILLYFKSKEQIFVIYKLS